MTQLMGAPLALQLLPHLLMLLPQTPWGLLLPPQGLSGRGFSRLFPCLVRLQWLELGSSPTETQPLLLLLLPMLPLLLLLLVSEPVWVP